MNKVKAWGKFLGFTALVGANIVMAAIGVSVAKDAISEALSSATETEEEDDVVIELEDDGEDSETTTF